jgi:hypothetical protein
MFTLSLLKNILYGLKIKLINFIVKNQSMFIW